MERYLKQKYPNETFTQYIGYTLNENRSVQNTDVFTFSYPLKEIFKMTEEDWKQYLINQEMENPLYRYFSRTGCAICPAQSEKAWYEVYKNFPETWEYMRFIENRLQWYVKSGYEVINPYWFKGEKTIAQMEAQFNRTAGSLFDFSDEPLKDCFCKI